MAVRREIMLKGCAKACMHDPVRMRQHLKRHRVRKRFSSEVGSVDGAGESVEQQSAHEQEPLLARGVTLAAQSSEFGARGMVVPFPQILGRFLQEVGVFSTDKSLVGVSRIYAFIGGNLLEKRIRFSPRGQTRVRGSKGSEILPSRCFEMIEQYQTRPERSFREQEETTGAGPTGVKFTNSRDEKR